MITYSRYAPSPRHLRSLFSAGGGSSCGSFVVLFMSCVVWCCSCRVFVCVTCFSSHLQPVRCFPRLACAGQAVVGRLELQEQPGGRNERCRKLGHGLPVQREPGHIHTHDNKQGHKQTSDTDEDTHPHRVKG